MIAETLQERQERIRTAPARRVAAVHTLVKVLKASGRKVKLVDFSEKNPGDFFGFRISVDGEDVRVACRVKGPDIRFIVGDYDRHRKKNQFPEPRAGFDFAKVAAAVESWAKYTRERERLRKERDDRENQGSKELRKLLRVNPKLKPLGENVETTQYGFNVVLRCETIDQVEALLTAAKIAKVEA
jgi:hypothetical protein